MVVVIPMKVNALLRKAYLGKVKENHIISNLTSDSRQCARNSVFISTNGSKEHIRDAVERGAKTIITGGCEEILPNINYIFVENVRKTLALLAKIFYSDISKKIKLIGITGTNGKTTTSTLGYSFFNYLQLRSMLIGTNGVFYPGFEGKSENTTPDILTIYHYLTIARKKRISYVFMEISSISVDQYRIYGLDFDCLIFTNFSQDHLDYHKTSDQYLYCKLIPFIKLKPSAYAIVNADDMAFEKILKYTDAKALKYGLHTSCDFEGTLNYANEAGISFYAKNLLFKSKMLGEFNIYNALAVMALCDVFHISYLNYVAFLANFTAVEGRMNRIVFDGKTVIIDYAHTFSATQRVIEEGLKLCKGNLFIVLGCGGNREKEKRAMIGKYLNTIPAQIILTTDNPRFEKPESIVRDIKRYIHKDVEVILDRKKAVLKTLASLQRNDYALILGKGCEKYMDIQGVKYPYSDLEVIHEWISNS